MRKHDDELLRKILNAVHEETHVLRKILYFLESQNHFSLRLTLFSLPRGNPMSTLPLPITTIPVGGNGQLVVQLLQNGAVYVAPAGAAPYTFTPSVTSNDTDITVSPASIDVTGGAVPLSQQFLIVDATGDTVSSFILTATATAPDGTALTDTLTINVSSTPPTSTFSLSMALYPTPASVAAALKR